MSIGLHILDYLEKLNLGKKGDLCEFFLEKYPYESENEPKIIKLNLDWLSEDSLIHLWTADYIHLGEIYNSDVLNMSRYINTGYKINAVITLKGRNYLSQHKYIENQISLNNSFKSLNETEIPSSNKRQRRLVRVSLAVAAASALFAAGSVWVGLSDKSATSLQKIDTTLQQQSKILEDLQKDLQNLQKKDILKNADTLKFVQVKQP